MNPSPTAFPQLQRALWLAPLVLLLLLLQSLSAEEAKDLTRACRMCHQQARFAPAALAAGPHNDLACDDCHLGYQTDPHQAVELPDEEEIAALAHLPSADPSALAMCADCHSDVVDEEPGVFQHGESSDATQPGHPYCLDCHGDPHLITRISKLEPADQRAYTNERCMHCHGDTELMEAAGVSTHVVETYEHSMHFRKLSLGHADAPGCVDCHGAHEHRDMKVDGMEVCSKCHEDATPEFVALATHAPSTREERPISYWTTKFFAVLTFLTIMVLAFHICLDFVSSFRAGATIPVTKKSPPSEPAPGTEPSGTALPHEPVLRFDVHQRLQHAILALSFSCLVLTGWPLSAHGVGTSTVIVTMFGGLDNCALIHCISAIGLAITSLYHVAYLAVSAKRRKKPVGMLPAPSDVLHVWQNVKFFLGVSRNRPYFGKYSYVEKFDYWAVFWGMVIMLGSGAIRWFPDLATTFLPTWVYEIAFHAHADEALLAALAIFIWHFYNVHLRPAIFPMSWVFLTGRQSLEEVALEHPAQYDEIVEAREGEKEGSAS